MQRPRSIVLIGWLFVLVGAAGLLKDLWPLVTADAANHLARLKAEGLWDIGPAWTSRTLAIVGGIGLMRGHNGARWLLVVWMLFHVYLSVIHSMATLLTHVAIFIPITWLIFRRSMGPSFNGKEPAAS